MARYIPSQVMFQQQDLSDKYLSINFFAKWLLLCINLGKFSTKRSLKKSTLTQFSNFKFSFQLNKLHHRCVPDVLKILEQPISEHLQMDNSAVEQKTHTQEFIY